MAAATPYPSAPALPRLAIFEAVLSHRHDLTAVVHSRSGRRFGYGELPLDVWRARARLRAAQGPDLAGRRIAFLVENGYDYVVTLLAIFAADAIAVPLSAAFPAPELRYILHQSQPSLLVTSARFLPKAQEALAADPHQSGSSSSSSGDGGANIALVVLEKHLGRDGGGASSTRRPDWGWEDESSGEAKGGRGGMILYTSGTTSRPKGVLLPHAVLTAQSKSLLEAWKYSPHDRLLHVLPLHHIHGIVNAVLAPLFAGSAIEFLFPFNADAVWRRLAAPFQTATEAGWSVGVAGPDGPDGPAPPITFFTVVPTVYSRLLATHRHLPADMQAPAREALSPQNMRVAISGSAALPTPAKRAWKELSHGNVLLERYGMTEVGMALSGGLDLADRVDGSVGWPLPGVDVRLVDLDSGRVIGPGDEIGPGGRERHGEIQLRGPTIFAEYWRNPAATASEFVAADGGDGAGPWFKTGDVAIRRAAPAGAGLGRSQPWARGPMYFIQGRISADLIKSGGEKVSALEVERELLSLPEVAEAAVVAVPSGRWGHKVGAVIVLSPDGDGGAGPDAAVARTWSPMSMRTAMRGRLASYKIPQVMRVVDMIPKNAMGKVNKKQLVKDVFADDFSGDEFTGRAA